MKRIILGIIISLSIISLLGCRRQAQVPVMKPRPPLVAFIGYCSDFNYVDKMKQSAETAAKEDNLRLEWYAPKAGMSETEAITDQIFNINKAITDNAKLIIIHPVNFKALGDAIRNAELAGIPIIVIENGGIIGPAVSVIATDEREAGNRAGEIFAKETTGKVAFVPMVKDPALIQLRVGLADQLKDRQIIEADSVSGAVAMDAKAIFVVDTEFTPNANLLSNTLIIAYNSKPAYKFGEEPYTVMMPDWAGLGRESVKNAARIIKKDSYLNRFAPPAIMIRPQTSSSK